MNNNLKTAFGILFFLSLPPFTLQASNEGDKFFEKELKERKEDETTRDDSSIARDFQALELRAFENSDELGILAPLHHPDEALAIAVSSSPPGRRIQSEFGFRPRTTQGINRDQRSHSSSFFGVNIQGLTEYGARIIRRLHDIATSTLDTIQGSRPDIQASVQEMRRETLNPWEARHRAYAMTGCPSLRFQLGSDPIALSACLLDQILGNYQTGLEENAVWQRELLLRQPPSQDPEVLESLSSPEIREAFETILEVMLDITEHERFFISFMLDPNIPLEDKTESFFHYVGASMDGSSIYERMLQVGNARALFLTKTLNYLRALHLFRDVSDRVEAADRILGFLGLYMDEAEKLKRRVCPPRMSGDGDLAIHIIDVEQAAQGGSFILEHIDMQARLSKAREMLRQAGLRALEEKERKAKEQEKRDLEEKRKEYDKLSVDDLLRFLESDSTELAPQSHAQHTTDSVKKKKNRSRNRRKTKEESVTPAPAIPAAAASYEPTSPVLEREPITPAGAPVTHASSPVETEESLEEYLEAANALYAQLRAKKERTREQKRASEVSAEDDEPGHTTAPHGASARVDTEMLTHLFAGPWHLVFKGEQIRALIEQLGGRTAGASTGGFHIYFGGELMGRFEVLHDRDPRGYLNSYWIQRVLQALRKATRAGYIPVEVMPEGWNADEIDFGYRMMHRNFFSKPEAKK